MLIGSTTFVVTGEIKEEMLKMQRKRSVSKCKKSISSH